VLRNCPFRALVEEHDELICAMNLELIGALVAGLSEMALEAVFEPGPPCCCVRVVETGAA